ncbi:MAG: hypothetical protein MK200_07300, partial [Nitrosopumilus sp.]|nr:hypothetical protein [Nitrosopumilus sp.]
MSVFDSGSNRHTLLIDNSMNNTTEEQIQIGERDRAITQHLLSNNIIEDTSGKISKCGNWINL